MVGAVGRGGGSSEPPSTAASRLWGVTSGLIRQGRCALRVAIGMRGRVRRMGSWEATGGEVGASSAVFRAAAGVSAKCLSGPAGWVAGSAWGLGGVRGGRRVGSGGAISLWQESWPGVRWTGQVRPESWPDSAGIRPSNDRLAQLGPKTPPIGPREGLSGDPLPFWAAPDSRQAGKRPAWQAARRTDPREGPHQDPQIKAAGMDQRSFPDVLRPSQPHPPQRGSRTGGPSAAPPLAHAHCHGTSIMHLCCLNTISATFTTDC